MKKQITIPVFIPHLGCRHRCAFCNQFKTSSSKSIPRKINIEKTVKSYLSNISRSVNRVEMAFFGGSFTGIDISDQKYYLSIANEYLNKNIIHGIRVSTRPDCIDKERLMILKNYNVSTIELGIQSFDDFVLSASKRGHNSADSLRAIKLIRDFNFKFIIQLMPGLPGDNFKKSLSSAEIAADINPHGIRIYPAVVLSNTELHNMFINNFYEPLSLNMAIELCKDMLFLFNENNIPVIRIGLHPVTSENLDEIIAGPYHPSFGFFVKSRLKRDLMEKKLIKLLKKSEEANRSITILVPYQNKEEFIGYKKENINYLKNKFIINDFKYRIDNLSEIDFEIK